MKRPGYAVLARNLMNAVLAHRLGTAFSTQDRNNKELPDEDIGEYWYDLAQTLDRQAAQRIDAALRPPADEPNTIQ